MTQPGFFSSQWAAAAAEALTAGPSEQARAGKLPMYWDFYDLIKGSHAVSWALGCRDLPAELGKGPAYLVVQWHDGTAQCRIAGPDEPLDATYVLGMDYAGWQALHDGYDAQRTVMYRKILLEEGSLLEFFKTIYFFAECLAIIGAVPAGFPALAVS
jgi:hypothetical protein